jgi:hypothetical protein
MANFSSGEPERFATAFHTYLCSDPKSAFDISLSDVFKWIGCTRIGAAASAVRKHLMEGIHYKTVGTANANEQVRLSLHGFKLLCQKIDTRRSQVSRDYLIAMEDVVNDRIRHRAEMQECTLRDTLRALEESEAELARLRSKTYEDVPVTETVYVNKAASELHRDVHKVGKSMDEKKRVRQFNTAHAEGTRMLYVQRTSNGALVEKITHNSIKKYGVGGEHFNCDVEHTIRIVKVAGSFVDALASCYDGIASSELRDILIQKIVCALDPISVPSVYTGPVENTSSVETETEEKQVERPVRRRRT